MPHQLEIRISEQVRDIALTSSKEVVHTDDFVPLKEEPFRKMGAEKSGSAGDENTHEKSKIFSDQLCWGVIEPAAE